MAYKCPNYPQNLIWVIGKDFIFDNSAAAEEIEKLKKGFFELLA